ncbi:Uncharacterized protein DBV15_02674 [Temnothorax longispinosus]|uniref:Uncharacterized protein n=1 Tax=Temnothorax longispinosus TaxID=300112 RepID=A0A4S2K910_9HYME|nr:Uncharacterized protein DBV15_02674 [Temnothorax longispinosus]
MQKRYYDRGSKELKQFKIGDTIKIHNENKQLPHQGGKVIGLSDNPRSYKIKTEQGNVIERNRRALTVGKRFVEETDIIDSPTENQFESSNHSTIETEKPQQSVVETTQQKPIVRTRAGRVVNKPDYLKDYVCMVNRELNHLF